MGEILQGFLRLETEIARLKRLERDLKSAKIQGKNHCVKCGFCCQKRSCIPSPDEVFDIAKFLEINVKDMIDQYFAIDRLWLSKIYYLKPVGENTKDLSGKFIPSDRTFEEGKCIFLGADNLCKIYSVRPKNAKEQKCWADEKFTEDDIVGYWKDNVLLKRFGIDGERLEKIKFID